MMRTASHFWNRPPSPTLILLVWLLVGSVTIALYAPFGLYFLNDDFIHIPLSEQAIFGQRHSIRVMNDFSLYIDSLLYGKNAVGFHFTNLLLHLANTVLLFFTCKKILRSFDLPVSHLQAHAAAMFFALYPFHSESVFWLIGRTGALSALWLQLAFHAQGRKSLVWQLAGTLSYLAGLFTYESVLVYPVLLGAIWLYQKPQKRASSNHWLRQLLLTTAATILYIIVRLVMLGGVTDNYESGTLTSGNMAMLVSNYGALVLRLFAPPYVSNLVFFAVAMAIIIAIILLVVRSKEKWMSSSWKFVLLVAVLLASLLPYISLGIDTHGVESERYLYVPSLFLAILAPQVVRWLSMKQRWVLSGVYFLFACFFLIQSSIAFRRASAFSEQIVQTTASYLQSNHQCIRFINMPGEHRGVVVMRLGLTEGIQWLVPAAKGKEIDIIDTNTDPFLKIGRIASPMVVSKKQLSIELAQKQIEIPSNTLAIAYIGNQLFVAP